MTQWIYYFVADDDGTRLDGAEFFDTEPMAREAALRRSTQTGKPAFVYKAVAVARGEVIRNVNWEEL